MNKLIFINRSTRPKPRWTIKKSIQQNLARQGGQKSLKRIAWQKLQSPNKWDNFLMFHNSRVGGRWQKSILTLVALVKSLNNAEPKRKAWKNCSAITMEFRLRIFSLAPRFFLYFIYFQTTWLNLISLRVDHNKIWQRGACTHMKTYDERLWCCLCFLLFASPKTILTEK